MRHALHARLDSNCSTALLRDQSAIKRLDADVRRLLPQRDITLDPQFFLASVSKKWSPLVAVVSRDETIVGIVYAKERRVAGLPTGIVYVDGRLHNMVVADPADEEDVIGLAIPALLRLRRVRGLRLAIRQNSNEARAIERAQSAADYDVGYAPALEHARLPVPASYHAFLQSLGSKTRRNFRYYRRQFETEGHSYVANLSASDLRTAASQLRNMSHIRSAPDDIARALAVIAAADNPWVVGLKHRNGEWLSVSGGWFSGRRATMFFQMNNDRTHGDASLSVVLRAYLIEALIQSGIRELVFWSGSAPPLARYAPGMPAMRVHLDVRSPGWQLIRTMIGWALPCFPRRISKHLSWIFCSQLSPDPLLAVAPDR